MKDDQIVININIKGPDNSDLSCEQSKVVKTVWGVLWVKLPDNSVISLIKPTELLLKGEIIPLLYEYTFNGIEPAGSYEIGGRLLHPSNGNKISTDIEVFTFNPVTINNTITN